MDAILLEKSSSKKKKREQFTINHLEIERSPVPISGPGFYKSSTSPRTPASSETRFGYALDVKEASYDVTEDDPNFSKNSYKHVSSSSKNSSSIHALYPSTRPSAKPPMNLETSSGKALSNKKKMDSFTQDDDNLTNLSSSNAGPVFCLSTNSEPSIGSETTPEQASDNNKKWNSVYGDIINSTKNLNSSFGSYSCPCPGHSSEASTSTITTSCMKPIDAKTSDGSATISQSSCNSPQSDILDSSSSTTAPIKRHTGHDSRWEAIQLASSRDPPLGLGHFKLLKRLGYGDIGGVYLVELKGTGTHFAMKVMDRASIISRNKLIRAQTEREILSLLDHPFLPTLYSHFDTEKNYCLVMEYYSGGNLYSLRQKQPNKYFTEQAARDGKPP